MTVAEYLRHEETSAVRHEYVRGEVFAVTGGTFRHNRIAINVLMHLETAMRGGRCHAVINDVKVQAASDLIYYPDVAVECAERKGDDLILDQPCLVVEVTSKGTRRVDRGEKLDAYCRIPSLRAYLIIDQTRRRVTHHWRDPIGVWQSDELPEMGTIHLSCPETDLTLDQIYRDVELPPLGVAEGDWDSGVEEYGAE
jgi:Uma2 family endonuclease